MSTPRNMDPPRDPMDDERRRTQSLKTYPPKELTLLEALEMAVKVAQEARMEWDAAPGGMRAGKILIALAGDCPGYRADIDAIHAAIARAKPEPEAEQPDFTYWECPDCGSNAVTRNATASGLQPICVLCAGDSGRETPLIGRVAKNTDTRIEGYDARKDEP